MGLLQMGHPKKKIGLGSSSRVGLGSLSRVGLAHLVWSGWAHLVGSDWVHFSEIIIHIHDFFFRDTL